MTRRFSFLAIFFLLLFYWAVSLQNLTVIPLIHQDEPWQAASGWKFATSGIFGSDMFAGFYNMESRDYEYMPLHPLLLAGIYKWAGLGLFQTRFESVALGLLTLALTFGLARRLFHDTRLGALAIAFLLFVRLFTVTPLAPSGILFLNASRIARYDMLVPVLVLTAFHLFLGAQKQKRSSQYLTTGIFAGLAGLAHLYGAFVLAALMILVWWNEPASSLRSRLTHIGQLLFGFALAWLPYLIYVLTDLPDWQGQTREYANRFDLLNWQWYGENLLNEVSRYAIGERSTGIGFIRRAGVWSTLIILPTSIVMLVWRAWHSSDSSARSLLVPTLLFPILFALLLSSKFANYLVMIIPFVAICAAWGCLRIWDGLTRINNGRVAQFALVLLGLMVFAEGTLQIGRMQLSATTTTPYSVFMNRVREKIPSHARVLGLTYYWLGLSDFDYRSFILPVWLSDPHLQPDPMPFDKALDRVAPDIVLLDGRMRGYFDSSRVDGNGALFYSWLAERNGQIISRIRDNSYGLIEVYQVERAR